MKKITFLNRFAFIAILQVTFLLNTSAQGWGCISLPGTGLSGIDCGMLKNTTGKFTLETWISGGAFVASNLDNSKNGFDFKYNSYSQINSQGVSAWIKSDIANQNAAYDVWEHVALVFDGTSAIFYVNGEEKGNMPFAKSFVSSTLKDLLIGRNNYSLTSGSKVKYSDFRIWSTARTQEEITANFQSHVPASSPGLVINYTFEEQTGTTTSNIANPTNPEYVGSLMDPENVIYTWGRIGVVPTNLTTSNRTGHAFKLTWNGGMDSSWEVQIEDPDGGGLVDTKSTNSDSIVDLTASSYTVKVRAIYPLQSGWSAPMIVNLTTGISENQVYNSTITNQKGMMSINNLEGVNDIRIYNASGTLVKQFKSTETTCRIDGTTWMSGLYLVNVNNGEKQKVFKIII
jgi:hypothetical protein